MKKVSKKIVAITGASGALGSEFIKKYKNNLSFRVYKDKIENKKKLNNWLNDNLDIEYFLHFAAITAVSKTKNNPKKTYKINSTSSISLINKLNKKKFDKLKYFLFSSSSHVYKPSLKSLSENSLRKPMNIYGNSKKRVEDFIIQNKKRIKFEMGIARIFNFYSPKHGNGFFISDMKKKLKFNNKILRINTLRDYINLDQLCEIIFFMINKNISKPLNIASGRKINLTDLSKLIIKKYSYKANIAFEKKTYPGLFANINLLRKLGYKKKITKFKFK